MNRREFLKACGSAVVLSQFHLPSRVLAAQTDPEILITLHMGNRGSIDDDLKALDSYGRPPESIRQFFNTARNLFDQNRSASDPFSTFANNAPLASAADQNGIEILGGPMLGDIRPEGASVWLRTVKPANVSVQVTTGLNNASKNAYILGSAISKVEMNVKTSLPQTFGPVQTSPQSDLSAVVRLDGLKPNTQYSYQVLVDGHPLNLNYPAHFTTLQDGIKNVTCKIAFGSCFHKAGIHNPHLLGLVTSRKNNAAVWLGDIAAGDRNNKVGLHRSDYLLRDLAPAWQKLSATVPQYASWDDHDYYDNDKGGVQNEYDKVRQVWTQNWNNPAYGQNNLGIYFHTKIGPVDLIMLDTRMLRKSTKGMVNAYLGDTQTQWLRQELLKCTGPFTIISSGTMWSDNISAGKDSWGTWDPAGRESLFQFIEDNHIPGVLLISGDRHGVRGIKIPRPSGYNFHEFEPATLGGMSGPQPYEDNPENQFFGYGRDLLKAFGEFTFDTTPQDPTVTFRLVKETGQILETFVFTQSQLTPQS